ncbi:phiSA1p31-related protein [Streptomyces sp. NPDC101455]|uniref:phiSA1p31-related protein n=1 Tax=Streptomyces sp. NPDC101455 TaxID=3366142 RepID=UPI0038184F09
MFQNVQPQPLDDEPGLSTYECACVDPDDQYLVEIDAGTVFLTHKACGKTPQAWLDDAFSMGRVAVTLHWHHEGATHEDDDNAHGVLTINGLAVVYENVPYLIGREYTDREGDVWHVTDERDRSDRPLVHLLPEAAGESLPLEWALSDYGPFTLVVGSDRMPGRASGPTGED